MVDKKRQKEPMRIVLTMPRDLVERIDDYRAARRIWSRAEAVRDLCEESLRRHGKKPPKDEPS